MSRLLAIEQTERQARELDQSNVLHAHTQPPVTTTIAFDNSTATWTWSATNRLVSDTWLQVQVQQQRPPLQPMALEGPVEKKRWSSGTYLELSKVKAAGKSNSDVIRDGEPILIPFWDKSVRTQLFGGLEAAIQDGQDVTLRMSVYGGRGQSGLALSDWMQGQELLRHAAGCRPQKTAVEIAAEQAVVEQRAKRKREREAEEAQKRQKAAQDRVLAEQRRAARETQQAIERAQQEAAKAASKAAGWRPY
eukprot:SAG31_NODE_13015_length_899_cov_1.338750_1_plen_248_part_10